MSGRHGRPRAGRRLPRSATGPVPRSPGPRSRATAPASGSQPGPAVAGSRVIFRKEALEFRVRSRDAAGGVVRLGAPWLRWSYWLALTLVAAGVLAMMVTPAGQSAAGPAVIDPGSGQLAALFPVAVAPELPQARALTLQLPGGGSSPARVTGVRVRLAGAGAVTRAGLAPPHQPSILLTGRLLSTVPAAGGVPAAGSLLHADMVVTFPARPVAAVLGQELKVVLGGGGAGA